MSHGLAAIIQVKLLLCEGFNVAKNLRSADGESGKSSR